MQALETLCQSFDPRKARSESAIAVFDVAGAGHHYVRVHKGTCTLSKGKPPADAFVDFTVHVSAADLDRMLKKELGFEQAYLAKRVRISGNILLANSMVEWFKVLQ